MLKVGIITFHFVNNFGGVLQAYALSKFIKREYNAEVMVIDYRNPFILFCDVIRLFPITVDTKEIVPGLVSIGQRFGRYLKTTTFIKHELDMSRKYLSYAGLKKIPPKCTHYIAGSDQIWNPNITFGIDKPYYLGFADKGNKKISYAASFGGGYLFHIQRKRIQKFLGEFDAVSIREELFRERIKKIVGKNAILLIDPVFLLEKSEWNNMCNPIEEDTDYILLYIMQPDKSVYELARRIKKETGKKVIEISRYGFKREFVDRIYINVGPKEFIGLLRNARYVCTNSYHGVAFSLIFEKDLYLIKCRRFQERLNTLTKIFGLSDPDHSYLHQVMYDKQYVKNMLQKERKKAYCYLKGNLTEKYD